MRKIENIPYTVEKHPQQVLDLYLPDSDTFPLFIYFHGGGLVGCDKTDKTFYPELQAMGVGVISANYRLYPEAVYPEFIQDAAAVVGWAQNFLPDYAKVTVTDIFIGGSSAGGYLTQMLCFDKKYLEMQRVDPDSISGYVMDAGQPTTHFNVLKARGVDTRRVIIDEAAPIYHINEQRNYPPMKIIVSDHDMENRYEQTMLLLSTLKHFGHEEKAELTVMENTTHCSYVREADENGNNIFGKLVYDFMKKHAKGM